MGKFKEMPIDAWENGLIDGNEPCPQCEGKGYADCLGCNGTGTIQNDFLINK